MIMIDEWPWGHKCIALKVIDRKKKVIDLSPNESREPCRGYSTSVQSANYTFKIG